MKEIYRSWRNWRWGWWVVNKLVNFDNLCDDIISDDTEIDIHTIDSIIIYWVTITWRVFWNGFNFQARLTSAHTAKYTEWRFQILTIKFVFLLVAIYHGLLSSVFSSSFYKPYSLFIKSVFGQKCQNALVPLNVRKVRNYVAVPVMLIIRTENTGMVSQSWVSRELTFIAVFVIKPIATIQLPCPGRRPWNGYKMQRLYYFFSTSQFSNPKGPIIQSSKVRSSTRARLKNSFFFFFLSFFF